MNLAVNLLTCLIFCFSLRIGQLTSISMEKALNSEPKHILNLSAAEKRAYLNSFDNIVSDLDGVAWHPWDMTIEIPKAADGYKLLQNAGKNISFVTNNSLRPVNISENKLKKMGVDASNIWSPPTNIVRYLKSINFKGLIYVVATEDFKNIIRNAGFDVIDGPNENIEESHSLLAAEAKIELPVRAVVVDFDYNLSYIKLTRARVYLGNPDCLFLTGAVSHLLPLHPYNVDTFGGGAIVKILRDVTNREPLVLAKPSPTLIELFQKYYKEPKRTLMIGDTLNQDNVFGRRCGFQTLFVLSGSSKLKDMNENSECVPDYYADSMGDFVEFFKDL